MSNQRQNSRFRSSLAAAMMLCATAQAALAYDYDVYRGVNANANTGRAQLNPGTFRFNPDLSTFDAANRPASQCYYQFTVTGLPNAVPVQGDAGTIVGLAGYTGTFNDVPPGHWNIAAPNGTAPQAAAQAVALYAQGNRGNVVNGTLNNCN